MPIELKRWFQILCGFLGISIAIACWLVVKSFVPEGEAGARLALLLLLVGAGMGISRLMEMFLPPLLVRLFPQLEQ